MMEQWNTGIMGRAYAAPPNIPPFHYSITPSSIVIPAGGSSAGARFFRSLPGTQGLPEILRTA
jgi:hypothetical protein